MKKIFLLLLLLIAVGQTHAATIKGSVYDLDLLVVNDSVVQINTNPQQTFVAADGNYEFSIPMGNYTLNASVQDNGKLAMFTKQELEIRDDGIYKLDLILFPEIDFKGDVNENDIVIERVATSEQHDYTPVLLVVIIVVIVIFIIIYSLSHKKKQPQTQDYDIEKLSEFIRKNKRVTQKEIRKEFPHSEAKISLMIAELEHDGKIKKIKKGRGNIIVYK